MEKEGPSFQKYKILTGEHRRMKMAAASNPEKEKEIISEHKLQDSDTSLP